MALDAELRRRILAFFAANQRTPSAAEVDASAEDSSRLQERHALVVDADGNIVIADPFSGVPHGLRRRKWRPSLVRKLLPARGWYDDPVFT